MDPVTIPQAPHLYTSFFASQPVGQYSNYKVTAAYSNNQYFAFYYVNGGLIAQQPIQFGSYRSTADSEINTLANQMPGGYSGSNQEVFSGAKNLVNGTWQAMTGNAVNCNSTYFGVSLAVTYHTTWDKDCAS
jgi:hypothetical protein